MCSAYLHRAIPANSPELFEYHHHVEWKYEIKQRRTGTRQPAKNPRPGAMNDERRPLGHFSAKEKLFLIDFNYSIITIRLLKYTLGAVVRKREPTVEVSWFGPSELGIVSGRTIDWSQTSPWESCTILGMIIMHWVFALEFELVIRIEVEERRTWLKTSAFISLIWWNHNSVFSCKFS